MTVGEQPVRLYDFEVGYFCKAVCTSHYIVNGWFPAKCETADIFIKEHPTIKKE